MKILCLFLLLLTFSGCGAGISDFSEEISEGYYYHSNSSIDRFIAPKKWGTETLIIPSKVVNYKSNKEYIVAKRQDILITETGSRTPITEKYDYWILDVVSPKIYGPMALDDFIKRKEELNLPESLNLK